MRFSIAECTHPDKAGDAIMYREKSHDRAQNQCCNCRLALMALISRCANCKPLQLEVAFNDAFLHDNTWKKNMSGDRSSCLFLSCNGSI